MKIDKEASKRLGIKVMRTATPAADEKAGKKRQDKATEKPAEKADALLESVPKRTFDREGDE